MYFLTIILSFKNLKIIKTVHKLNIKFNETTFTYNFESFRFRFLKAKNANILI